jgi:hypothetical protein
MEEEVSGESREGDRQRFPVMVLRFFAFVERVLRSFA